ncbi:MAG: hypothetical protein K6V97_06405 [Actinomycetia bacterium]|jgi:hypothetical protein|nr:hypothetical protein [Actinomycetes bacterium]
MAGVGMVGSTTTVSMAIDAVSVLLIAAIAALLVATWRGSRGQGRRAMRRGHRPFTVLKGGQSSKLRVRARPKRPQRRRSETPSG